MLKQRFLELAGIMLLSVLSAACAGAQQPGPAAPPAAAPEGVAQPKVNRLVMALVPGNSPETNAPRFSSQPIAWVLEPMHEYLIGVDAQTGKLVPELATEWSLEPSGTSLRFKLRKGVPFQKGWGEFTAKDVVYTHNDFIQSDSTHGESPYWRSVVKAVEVVNDLEVIFHLSRPDGDFINALSRWEGDMMAIQSKANFDAKGAPTMQTEPTAGTGPYQFKERVQGSYLLYERVPYKHWKVTPDFPEFQFRFIKEHSTRLAALLAGEVHVTSLPEDLLKQAESQGFKVIRARVPGLRTFLSFTCCFFAEQTDPSKPAYLAPPYVHPDGPSPLMDVRVRKALNKAIDREALNKAFFGNKGELMLAGHMHPARPGWNPDWEKGFPEAYGYDPAKARALLLEAGYGPDKPLTTSLLLNPAAGISGTEDIVEAIAGYWRVVGVKPNLETIDLTVLAAGNAARKYNNLINLNATSANPLIGLVYISTTGGTRTNSRRIADLDMELLIAQIYGTLDTQKQADLLRRVGDINFEKYLEIPLFWIPSEAVVNRNVVADYLFPGSISGTWTHIYNIKAAR